MNVAPFWHVLTFILISYNLNILDMLYWNIVLIDFIQIFCFLEMVHFFLNLLKKSSSYFWF